MTEGGPTESAMENIVSSESSRFNTKAYLKEYFKPRYHMRRLRNKGAILVVLWSFLVVSTYSHFHASAKVVYNEFGYYAIQVAVGLTLPIAGWLADVRYGRYKVMCWSIWTMWMSSVLLTADAVMGGLVVSYKIVNKYITMVLLIPLGIGYGGFQAIIVQLGVDQLTDASTSEIKSFVSLYVWTLISGRIVRKYIQICAVEEYKLFGPLLISINLTAVATSNFLFNHILIKEPVTQNPFKLVYKVIKYAIKNSHPKRRSAFTYCEDHLPPRIDFGKSKYGGPFTIEQVEDVKTFMQILVAFFIVCALIGLGSGSISFPILNALNNNDKAFDKRTSNYIFGNFYLISGTILIPINEILVYPIFYRCLPSLKSYWKIIAGSILAMEKYIALITYITYSRQQYIDAVAPVHNATLQCLLQKPLSSSNYAFSDYRWLAIPAILTAMSDLMYTIGIGEFFCAQVPYSMKGLVAGMFYCILVFFLALAKLFLVPFVSSKIEWGMGTISCEFWYVLMKVLYLVIMTVIFLALMMKCYKARKRDDLLPNEHIFAERYYSRDN